MQALRWLGQRRQLLDERHPTLAGQYRLKIDDANEV